MKSIVTIILIVSLHFSINLRAQNVFFAIPFRATSCENACLPFWFNNPMNLQYLDDFKATFLVSPSKFLMPELNSTGCFLGFSLPLGVKSGTSIEYLGSGKFSYSNFKFALQRSSSQNFNFAVSINSSLISIESFGSKLKFSINTFVEYCPIKIVSIAFAYKNVLRLNDFDNQIAILGLKSNYFKGYTFGFETQIIVKHYTSYDFFIGFEPFENTFVDVNVQTNPQAITLGVGYQFTDFVLSMFLQYNNYLLLSQTIGLIIKL